MWAWRVVFPGAGLGVCLFVLWPTLQANDPRGRADATPKTSPSRPGAAGRPLGERVVSEGRIVARPGAEVTVGADAGGVVVEMPAREKDRVRKGDLLARFRADDLQAALAGAEARLAEAEADLVFQKQEFKRRTQAPIDGARLPTELGEARRDFEVSSARRKAAVAAVDQGRAVLSHARVLAPISGVVLARFVQAGETAAPGARLVTVCDLSKTRVEAEVDEFDAPRIVQGASVTVTAEGHPDASWHGTVEEIPDRVADRLIRPEDPGRPTDAGVLLVKIALTEPVPLKLGQRVEVEIETTPTSPP